MAHQVEPMDVDGMDNDFDKENTFHHSNMLPCTEKGYEELDVSELNMKLRYSVTPTSSPMSKSYTANCIDNRTIDISQESLNATVTENNLTRSLNTSIKTDPVSRGKSLPLQTVPADQFGDFNRNKSVLCQLETSVAVDNNVTISISGANDDESLSSPSSLSSALHTPEATTPTKDIPKSDGGSPIMRGLKSVLNMFRSSQSPIPLNEGDDMSKQALSPVESYDIPEEGLGDRNVLASTPIAAHRNKDLGSKRSSPYKDSIVFNDDLEKELQWKDETTILFSHEKIPIHKLFFQHAKPSPDEKPIAAKLDENNENNQNTTVEYMDISCNDSTLDKTLTDLESNVKLERNAAVESDSEFLDCETTFTKHDPDNEEKENMNTKNSTHNMSSDINTDEISTNVPETQVAKATSNYTSVFSDTLPIRPEIDNAVVPIKYTANLVAKDNDTTNVNDDNGRKHSTDDFNLSTQFVLEESGNKCVDETKSTDVSTKLTFDKKDSELVTDSLESSETNAVINILTEEIPPIIPSDGKYDEPVNVTRLVTLNPNTELPSNIPLPDDDVESEVDLPIDNIPQNLTTAPDLPATIKDKVIKHDITGVITTSNEIEKASMNVSCDVKSKVRQVIASVGHNPDMSVESMQLLNDIDHEIDLTIDFNTTVSLPETIDSKAIIHDVTTITKSNMSLTSEAKLVEEIGYSNPDMSVSSMQLFNDIENILESSSNTKELSMEEASLTIKNNEDNVDELIKADSTLIDENIDEIVALKKILSQSITTTLKGNVEQDESITQPYIPIESTTAETNIIKTDETLNNKAEITEMLPQDNSLGSINVESDIIFDKTTPPIIKSAPAIDSAPDEKLVNESNILTKHPIDDGSIIEQTDLKLDTIGPIPIEQVVEKITSIADPLGDPKQDVLKTNVVNAEAPCNMSIDETDDTLTLDDTVNTNVVLNEDNQAIAVDSSVVKKEAEPLVNKFEKTETTPLEVNTVDNIEQELHQTLERNVHEDTQKIKEEINSNELLPSGSLDDCIVEENIGDREKPAENDNIPLKSGCINKEMFYMVPETVLYTQEIKDNEVNLNEQITDNISASDFIKDEEIIVSENTSPFVSMIADVDTVPAEKLEVKKVDLENTFVKETNSIPPSSPPIRSKGYNFNFDDMEDPFATKTKIRLSPPPSTPDKSADDTIVKKSVPKRELQNEKRKSFPERKKPIINQNKFNSSVAGSARKAKVEKTKYDSEVEFGHDAFKVTCITPETSENVSIEFDKQEISEMDEFIANEVKCNENPPSVYENVESVLSVDVEDKVNISMTEPNKSANPDELKPTSEMKSTSSSDQSNYYSLGTSSSESLPSKNVFNLPEIDDMNFNPFATKSKMRLSPPPTVTNSGVNTEKNYANTAIWNNNENNSDDKMEMEPMEKMSPENLSNTTCSSKNTDDINVTVREVNTEDEDTIEGPFLEAEDLIDQNIDQISDCDNVEPPPVEDFPAQANNMPGEMFIDAEAFEFLLNQNQTNIISDSGKESLFLKFDPLFAKRLSCDAFAALGKIQKRQSTPTKTKTPQQDMTFDKSPIAGPSHLNATYEGENNVADSSNEDLNVTVSKPMMVVTPAVNPAVTPRNKSLTPTRPNRRSITFTSPAMAVIDRLLSMSANNSLMGQDTTFSHPTREQHEADIALTQLRELLAEKEISVYNLRSESKELKDRLTTLETQMHSIEIESQDRLRKLNELTEKLSEKTRINRSMAAVVEEYERTIASLIAEIEQDKKRHAEERMQLIKERDEQTAHLSSMEVSFSDLHSKYEKSKQIILSCKAAEDTYKKTINESMENFKKMQNNYELLKQHATSKLNHANTELEKLNRSHEAEVLKLNAMVKRKDLHITSLEETLTQKTKANEELTAICDELINKVG